MDNNISFMGIKNIGTASYARGDLKKCRSISMVLTDDFNGKDLTGFRKAISNLTSKSSDYINSQYRNVINIELLQGCCNKGIEYGLIRVNGKEINLCDKNLPIFSFIARLTRKISTMQDKDMIVNRDYKNYAADDTLVYGITLSDMFDVSKKGFFDQFFDKKKVKNAAEEIDCFIMDIMNRYFEIT